MSIEATAIEFVAATKKRAQARSHLSALRKKWLEDNDTFFDKYESDGMEGYDDMTTALHDREQANTEYRRAKSRLFRACAAGLSGASDVPGAKGSDEQSWKLVPVEPTEAMNDALNEIRTGWMTIAEGYHALLSAAPQVVAPAGVKVDAPTGCHRSHPHENMDADCERKTVEARENNARARGVAPSCKAQPLTDERIREIWVEHGLDECDPEGFARHIEAAHGIGVPLPHGKTVARDTPMGAPDTQQKEQP